MENQLYVFFIFILNGFLIGILFDIFRILRKVFKTTDFITYIEDFLFWLLTAFTIIFSIFKFNNGNLRGFIIIGIFIGISIYLLLFSKIFIEINLFIINFINKLLYRLIFLPLKALYCTIKRIILKPAFFIIINFRRSLFDFIKKVNNLYNKNKKSKSKKDFR